MKELIPTNRALCIIGAIVLGCWAMLSNEYQMANGCLIGLFALIKGGE